MPSIPQVNQFSPQNYAPLYISINDTPQTEVQSISIDMISGSQDVTSIMREWAGVSKGSGRTECTLKSVVPYTDTDTGGVGFNTGGDTAAGVSLQQTMITNFNANLNRPVKFAIGLGSPAVQKYVFKGVIKDVNVEYSDSSVLMVTYKITGQLSIFS